MKTCSKCKESKSLGSFGLSSRAKDKRQRYCKSCQSIAFKTWQSSQTKKFNNDRAFSWKEKRRVETRTKLIEYFKLNPCVECGFSDPRALEFDHIDPSTKYKGVGPMIHDGRSWEEVMKEIKKCKVLCRNCHGIRTSEQFGHWTSYI